MTAATGAAAGGRAEEFTGAAAELSGANTAAVADVFGEAYDAPTRASVHALWAKHLTFLEDYAEGVAAGNGRKRDGALASLLAYAEEFGVALESITEGGLTKDGVKALVRDHVVGLKAVIDAQHEERAAKVVAEFEKASAHMAAMASGISTTIVTQKGIEGDAESRAAELRAKLNEVLSAHVAFAAMKTGATLGRRTDEAEVAKETLVGKNSEAIAALFGGIYGPKVEKAVLALWRAHLKLIEDYTLALRDGDRTAASTAVASLTAYATEFGTALASIVKGLSADAVATLVRDHVTSLKAVIDAQAGTDGGAQFGAFVEATAHMDEIAAALATAIAADQKY